MAMAQQQGINAQQPPTPGQGGALSQEQINQMVPNEQQLQQMGMPAGEDKESIKKRFLAMFEEFGVLKSLNPEGLRELTQKLDEFVDLLIAQDTAKLKEHPITKMLKSFETEIRGQQQAAPKQQAAGMMPPGGGMGGR